MIRAVAGDEYLVGYAADVGFGYFVNLVDLQEQARAIAIRRVWYSARSLASPLIVGQAAQ